MYDDQFFDVIRKGCQSSAAVVVPLVYAVLAPETVVDVGCGEGHWGKEFERLGSEVTGIDGAETQSILKTFVAHDLRNALPLALGTFDLAVCLEVAEHLPDWRADGIIEDLCRLAPVVLFSAAIPGQGGHGHVNEQWPRYWVDRFEAHNYAVSGALRFRLWECDEVMNWYRANILVAAAEGHRPVGWFDTPLAYPYALVHPVVWGHHRNVPAQ